MRACWARSCPGGRCPLAPWTGPRAGCGSRPTELGADPAGHRGQGVVGGAATTGLPVRAVVSVVLGGLGRSEEHTAELQSRGQLVCRLLLEKQKRTRSG